MKHEPELPAGITPAYKAGKKFFDNLYEAQYHLHKKTIRVHLEEFFNANDLTEAQYEKVADLIIEKFEDFKFLLNKPFKTSKK